MKRTRGITEHFVRTRRRLNNRYKVIVAMAAVVVFATVYALILPAITLNKETAEQTPGINLEQEMAEFNPTLQASTEKGDYTVGVVYGDDAGLPDGTQLKVSKLKKDSDDYKNAKKAVVKAKKKAAEKAGESFDEDDLGFAALDISLVDADGNKIEPKSDANVKVKIAMSDLPATAANAGITVQHIVRKKAEEAASSEEASNSGASAGAKANVWGSDEEEDDGASEAAKADGAKADDAKATESKSSDASAETAEATSADSSTETAELVAEGVGGKTFVDGATQQGTAEFRVTGFSTFTISWTKGGTGDDSAARVGSVNMRYVDSTGGVELDATTTPASDMLAKTAGDGGIVNIADWAASNGTSRVNDYTFSKATIGSRDGTQITGIKVATEDETETEGSGNSATTKTVTKYKLFYTSDEAVNANSTWTAYIDSASANSANNADVFLFYTNDSGVSHALPTLVFHRVDESGGKLAEDATWTATNGDPANASNFVFNDKWNGNSNIQDQQTSGVSDVGTWQKAYVGVFDSIHELASGNSLNYYYDSSKQQWHTGTGSGATNVTKEFLADGTATTTAVTTKGNVNANPVLYTEYWQVYGGTDAKKGVTVHYVDSSGNALNNVSDTFKTFSSGKSASLSDFSTSVTGYQAKEVRFGSNSGTAFDSITFSHDANQTDSTKRWSSSYKTSPDSADTSTGNVVNEVWVVYEPIASTNVKVHHVNQLGTEIAPATIQEVSSGGAVTADSLTKASNRTSNYAYSTYFMNGSTKQTFSSMTYSYDLGTNKWLSSYKQAETDESSTQTSDCVTDIYLLYTRNQTTAMNLILHHVDESGGVLHADTTWSGTSNWNGGRTDSSGAIPWDGFSLNNNASGFKVTGVGTYLTGYIGAFGQNESTGLMYKADGTSGNGNIIATGTGSTSDKHDYDASSHPNGVREIKVDNQSVVLTDIYQVYGGTGAKKGVTFHHVDASGNIIAADTYQTFDSGTTVTPSSYMQTSESGWAVKEARLGSASGSIITSITYTYDGTQTDTTKRWSSSAKNGDTNVSTDSAVNEIWLVYEPGASFTARYVDGDKDSLGDKTFSVALNGSQDFQADSGLIPATKPRLSSKGTGNLNYSTTRLGSVTGPSVNSVNVDSSGNVVYHFATTATLRQQGNGNWLASDASGRTFTLTGANGTYTLVDSQEDAVSLNLQSGTAGQAGAVYTATYHGENVTVEYTVTQNNEATFTLSLLDSIPSASRQVYVIYEGGTKNTDNKSIWINDDLAYSGKFKAGLSSALATDLETKTDHTVTDVVYTWHRKTTTVNSDGTDGTTTDTVVARKLTGESYNIAYDAKDRTWLDVAADEGDDIWTAGTKIFYYVTVDYKVNGEQQTQIQSDDQTVNYYGRLENGSFETPDLGASGGMSTSNANYKERRGVWQTTGTDSNTTQAYDIEIINSGATTWNANGYNWYESSFGDTAATFNSGNVAKDGHQFAELNAENAGALYQDVITHPDERLSYGLSHRARGSKRNSSPEYDTMYLVIMPTSLAMTSGANGGELTTQEDLQNFIKDHGGYSTTVATSKEDEITWQDYETGILIRKISSDDQSWHSIDVTDGYMATSSLTRFFFVAGPTTADKGRNIYTQGNFLDNVYFTQQPSETTGFHLRVTKTFSGLSQAQVAELASKNSDTTNSNPFTLSISNENINNVSESLKINDALKDAKLTFTAIQTGSGTYRYTPTASGTGVTLTSGNAQVDSSGNVVMSWIFSDQALRVGDTDATDQTFAYTVKESGTDVDGYSVTSSAAASLSGGSSTTTSGGTTSATANVTSGATASYTFTNSYRDNFSDDAPQITVRKVFSGATRSTVDKLLSTSPGYSVTVTKTKDAAGDEIASGSQPSMTLNANVSSLPTGVSFAESEDGLGRVVLTWTIESSVKAGTSGYSTAMGTPGTYTVQETGFTPTTEQSKDNNKLTLIEVNGSDNGVTLTDANGGTSDVKYADAVSATRSNLAAGDSSVTALNPKTTSSGVRTVGSDETINVSPNLNTETNLIIAKTAARSGGYLVWTSDTLGANARQAVVNFINNTKNLGKDESSSGAIQATLGDDSTSTNVSFRSGANPGKLTYSSATGALALSYDSASGALSFTNQPEVAAPGEQTAQAAASWSAYYAGTYEAADDLSAEFRIANVYDPIVKILKVDASTTSTDKPLQSASFRLFRLNSSGNKEYYLMTSTQSDPQWSAVSNVETNSSGTRDSSASETKALLFTSNKNGTVSLGALPVKTSNSETELTSHAYYLEEVTAPNGYNKLTGTIKFTVAADGTVALAEAGGTNGSTITGEPTVDNNPATIQWSDPYYTLRIGNSAGVVLPNTGGPGDNPLLLFAGLVLVAGALGGAVAWRRRPVGRHGV